MPILLATIASMKFAVNARFIPKELQNFGWVVLKSVCRFPLPRDALIELVQPGDLLRGMVRHQLRRQVDVAGLAARHLPQRWPPYRLKCWWRSRYAQMAENLPDHHRLGDEGDDLHLMSQAEPEMVSRDATTLRTQQGQHVVSQGLPLVADTGQHQRPDIARRFAMRWLRRVRGRPARLGGCIRVGGGDTGICCGLRQRSNGSPQQRDQRHEPIEQLHRRQHQTVAAAGAGFHALIDQMLGVDGPRPCLTTSPRFCPDFAP